VFSDVNKQTTFQSFPPLTCASPLPSLEGWGSPEKRGAGRAPRLGPFPAGGPVLAAEVGPAEPASAQVRGPGLLGAGSVSAIEGGGRALGPAPGARTEAAAATRNCGTAGRGAVPSGDGAAAGAMPPPKDVVKIAIQMVGAIPQLIELQQVPLGSSRTPPDP